MGIARCSGNVASRVSGSAKRRAQNVTVAGKQATSATDGHVGSTVVINNFFSTYLEMDWTGLGILRTPFPFLCGYWNFRVFVLLFRDAVNTAEAGRRRVTFGLIPEWRFRNERSWFREFGLSPEIIQRASTDGRPPTRHLRRCPGDWSLEGEIMQYPKDMLAIGGAAEYVGKHEEHQQVAPVASSAPRLQGYCMSMSVDGMFRPWFEYFIMLLSVTTWELPVVY